MRRTFGLVMLLCSVALLAVTPVPKPKPTFAPTPIATGTPFTSTNPIVLIYPFQTPSDLDARTGTGIAQVYQQVMAQAGGLTILPLPTNIKREDYTKYARTQHADYYVSGYVQPIGQSASIVANIVDVNSEIAVYSTTTQVESVPDVASQALNTRTVILNAAGIERPQVSTQASTPAPTASQGASMNVNNVLGGIGGLFKQKPKPGKTVANAPSPTPTPAKPSRAVIVNHLGGTASSVDQDAATNELFRALDAHYTTSVLKSPVASIAGAAESICGSNRNNTIAGGTLNAVREGGIRAHNTYTFKLEIYTCFGAVLYTTTTTDTDRGKTVRDAVDAYVKSFPNNQ